MAIISYNDCKKVYELYKEVYYWVERNEFRNSVIAFEEVANYLWDIDQDFSQKIYDFVHKMYDEVYFKNNKLPEFKLKIQDFKIQTYTNYLCGNYAQYRCLRSDSKEVVELCKIRHKDSYQKALALNTNMVNIERNIGLEFVKKVGNLIDNYYGQYDKLSLLTQEYVGRIL